MAVVLRSQNVGSFYVPGLAISSLRTFMLSKKRDETGVRVHQEDVLQGVVKHPGAN